MQLTNVSEIIAAFSKQVHVQRKRIDETENCNAVTRF